MKLFEGVYTALVTPFQKGKVDFVSLENLIEQQLEAGIAGFVVNGTTAESPTLTEEESFAVLDFVKTKTNGRAKIVFGSGSNSTAKTVQLSKKAQEAGVDGLLVVVPYYNKPPQEGLYQHFKTVAASVHVPIMLYNVPGRTVIDIDIDTVVRLSEIKNIVAIKEASGNLSYGKELISRLPRDFIVSSGDDESCLELRQLGGQGVVSVCSHVMPKQMVDWFHAEMSASFVEEFNAFVPFISGLYITANPIPVKAMLHLMGILETMEVRLPLVELTTEQAEEVRANYDEFSSRLG